MFTPFIRHRILNILYLLYSSCFVFKADRTPIYNQSGQKEKENQNHTAIDEHYSQKMKTEVSAAAGFVTSLLRTTGLLSEHQLGQFSLALEEALGDHYQHHWFPQSPCKGSGYRCIRINHKMDPVIGRAACTVGLTVDQLFSLLPSELTLWVDPYEVSYRIGEDGSICVLYESTPPTSRSDATDFVRCKKGLEIGRTSPSKSFNMMAVMS